jgi:hypothetical protein
MSKRQRFESVPCDFLFNYQAATSCRHKLRAGGRSGCLTYPELPAEGIDEEKKELDLSAAIGKFYLCPRISKRSLVQIANGTFTGIIFSSIACQFLCAARVTPIPTCIACQFLCAARATPMPTCIASARTLGMWKSLGSIRPVIGDNFAH